MRPPSWRRTTGSVSNAATSRVTTHRWAGSHRLATRAANVRAGQGPSPELLRTPGRRRLPMSADGVRQKGHGQRPSSAGRRGWWLLRQHAGWRAILGTGTIWWNPSVSGLWLSLLRGMLSGGQGRQPPEPRRSRRSVEWSGSWHVRVLAGKVESKCPQTLAHHLLLAGGRASSRFELPSPEVGVPRWVRNRIARESGTAMDPDDPRRAAESAGVGQRSESIRESELWERDAMRDETVLEGFADVQLQPENAVTEDVAQEQGNVPPAQLLQPIDATMSAAKTFLDLEEPLSAASQERREQFGEYFAAVGSTIAAVTGRLRAGELPSEECARLKTYVDRLPATFGDVLGNDTTLIVFTRLDSSHQAERLVADVKQAFDQNFELSRLEEASRIFAALATAMRPGHRG